MLPLFPVAWAYRTWRGRDDSRGDGLRRLIARWVSVYGETTPLYRFEVSGRERLPVDVPYVLVANHESGLDVLCLLMLRTPARFVAEDFLFAIPLAGWLFEASKQIPVTIGDRESGRRAMEHAAEALAEGTPVAFFPEGRLSPDAMIDFKPGAFVCAQRAGVPIVPVSIEGAGAAWRPGTLVVQGRHVIRMRILEPIAPSEHEAADPVALAAAVRQQMLDARTGRAAPGVPRARAAIVASVMLGLSLFLAGCSTAQKPYAIEADQSLTRIDDRDYDALLEAHVERGVVDYGAFCEAESLERYVDDVARVDLSSSGEAEKKALYLNAYNALSITSVLRGGSPSTLFGRYGFFVRARHRVAGREMNLLALERKVLVPMGDPRIHFALVCASASCPWLRSGVYEAAHLDAQLDEAARRFVNDPARNRFDPEKRRAEVSAIFDWYEEEFEAAAGSVAEYLARYVDEPELASALRRGRMEIDHLDYDWSLNGTPPGPRGRCATEAE